MTEQLGSAVSFEQENMKFFPSVEARIFPAGFGPVAAGLAVRLPAPHEYPKKLFLKRRFDRFWIIFPSMELSPCENVGI